MPGVTRKDIDTAIGTQLGNQNTTVFADGHNIIVIGDLVATHGGFPHIVPPMVQGSPNVFAEGIPICRRGDVAACGHPATGSGDVFANDMS